MKSAGCNSSATIGAKPVMHKAAEMVLDAVEAMTLTDDGTPFRVTDMGAADGGTSIDLWRRVLGRAREIFPSRLIEMIYTDLPRNDFSQVFQVVHGLTDIRSYLLDIPNTRVFASGTSFHNRIVMACTLDLGFSTTASHCIEAVSCAIEDRVHMIGGAPCERCVYEASGAEA